ncbi:MAG: hypothetical protein GXP14_08105 [Gammaproteobacteria bacterium]|nr:hypothetical protein [Gammaproteobacteria bacterium]
MEAHLVAQCGYLAIDQGGHASRAIIFDNSGHVLAHSETAIATNRIKPGWVEHDPQELLNSVQNAIQNTLKKIHRSAIQVVSAGLATQRSSIVCWNRVTGEALSPVISWQDHRAEPTIAALAAQQQRIHNKTGLFLSPHYGASKIKWCLDSLPAVQAALKNNILYIGPLASFLAAQLTAQSIAYIDPANAGRTLLWNLETQDWDPELLSLFGIPRSVLPQCTPSFFAYGDIKLSEIESKNHVIPLQLLTGDQPAALFAQGRPSAKQTYVNMGTGVFIQRLQKSSADIPAQLLKSLILTGQNETYHTLEGTINGGASALDWFAQHHQLQDWREKSTGWLKKEYSSAELPLFINTVGGLASPFWRTDITPHFVGEGSIAAQFVSVLESILFLIKVNMEYMDQYLSTENGIRVSGGLSLIPGLCQKLADLTQCSVSRSDQTEATAKGLAWLLAQQPAQTTTYCFYSPQKNIELLQRYRKWLTIMDKTLLTLRGCK